MELKINISSSNLLNLFLSLKSKIELRRWTSLGKGCFTGGHDETKRKGKTDLSDYRKISPLFHRCNGTAWLLAWPLWLIRFQLVCLGPLRISKELGHTKRDTGRMVYGFLSGDGTREVVKWIFAPFSVMDLTGNGIFGGVIVGRFNPI